MKLLDTKILRKTMQLVSIHLLFTLIKTLDLIFEWSGGSNSEGSKLTTEIIREGVKFIQS